MVDQKVFYSNKQIEMIIRKKKKKHFESHL